MLERVMVAYVEIFAIKNIVWNNYVKQYSTRAMLERVMVAYVEIFAKKNIVWNNYVKQYSQQKFETRTREGAKKIVLYIITVS